MHRNTDLPEALTAFEDYLLSCGATAADVALEGFVEKLRQNEALWRSFERAEHRTRRLGPPPLPPRREVVEARQLSKDVWVRSELVECGKKSCKSCPHGPYWYRYEWDEQKHNWRFKYLGARLEEPSGSLEQVGAQLSKLLIADDVSAEGSEKLRSIIRELAHFKTDASKALAKKARAELRRRERVRTERMRDTYELLSSRAATGAKLSSEEQAELARLEEIMQEDH